ncbi:DUF4123 domain-containing protein [Iodobacter sp.]|uniref:DUF4123 domain-containing protein n=1 Tax=Iodobacter sp. TaxID=1915058 RepID=UPI0025FCD4D4|nr:DUF4123 domain-containing protein [Iodobacter sp.]
MIIADKIKDQDTLFELLKNPEADSFWFVLIDAAFDAKKISKLTQSFSTSLYEHSSLEEYAELSPILVPMSRIIEFGIWPKLLAICNSRPMLSFIKTTKNIEELKNHFQYVHHAISGHKKWILRFADTRTIALLFANLDKKQKELLFKPMQSWLWPDRAGNYLMYTNNKTGEIWEKGVAEELELSDQQFADFIDQSAPDVLLRQLSEQFPDLLEKYSPEKSYQLSSIAIKESKEIGFENNQNSTLSLAVLWLICGENLAKQPEYLELKHKTSNGQTLQQALSELPSYFFEKSINN